MKRFIFAFGLVGLIGCFLPLALGLSWFDLRHFEGGWHVWLVIAAFALPTYVGLSKDESDGAAAVVGLLSFGYLTYTFGRDIWHLAVHSSIGGILMAIAIVAGLTSSLLALGTSRS